MTIEVLQNAGLLLAMAYLYDLLFLSRQGRSSLAARLVVGAGLGVIAIGVMASSWTITDGVILDTRSVLLGAAGLFFGAVPTVVAIVIASAYRIAQGGAGAATGVSVIAASGLIGLAWRSLRRGRLSSIGLVELYLLGIVIHVTMLVLFVVVPLPDPLQTVRDVAFPVLAIHPATFALLGVLMANRLDREETAVDIEESESRYRSIFENRHMVMFVLDPATGDLVDVNPRAEEYYGWPRAEMRRMNISQINTLPLDVVKGTMRSAKEQETSTFQFKHRLASGVIRDVEVQSGPIRMDGRDLLLTVVIDVTERRQLEAALGAAERQLRSLLDESERSKRTLSATLDEVRQLSLAVEQSPASVVITDVDGHIEYVNRAFTEVSGYTRDEVKGRNPRLLQSGLTSPETYESMWSALTQGRTWLGELCNRSKSGHLFWERAVISPVVDEHGTTIRFLAVKQDITAERAMVEQLRQAQKMEAVGRLAGGVAHDFNNKLQVILGYTELMAGAVDDAELRDHLDEVRRAAEQSAALTRQLLAFARRQPIQPEVLDLDEAVHGTLELVRRLVGEDVELTWRPGADGQRVLIDPGQLDQIITNLVVNARDAMPHGGQLDISTRVVQVDDISLEESTDATEGTFVLLEVADSGTGIDPALMLSLFEPFVTTKSRGAGTGLGLATVYGVVRQNGGLVRATNRPGGGAAFLVYLPTTDQVPEATPEEEAPTSESLRSETVLLAEDEAPILELVEQTLRRAGYQVIAAPGGASALERARRHLDSQGGSIDLLVTDVVMMDMNGRELSEQLAALLPDVKVLFVSGYTADVLADHGVMADGVEFLPKPFTASELTARVRELLDAEAP